MNKKRGPIGVETTSKGQDGLVWGRHKGNQEALNQTLIKTKWWLTIWGRNHSCISDNPTAAAWLCNQYQQRHFQLQIEILIQNGIFIQFAVELGIKHQAWHMLSTHDIPKPHPSWPHKMTFKNSGDLLAQVYEKVKAKLTFGKFDWDLNSVLKCPWLCLWLWSTPYFMLLHYVERDLGPGFIQT